MKKISLALLLVLTVTGCGHQAAQEKNVLQMEKKVLQMEKKQLQMENEQLRKMMEQMRRDMSRKQLRK